MKRLTVRYFVAVLPMLWCVIIVLVCVLFMAIGIVGEKLGDVAEKIATETMQIGDKIDKWSIK